MSQHQHQDHDHGAHDHGAHGHSHAGHSHAVPDSDRLILLAVVINLALTVAQVLGGWIADSMALIADGVHNLSDAMALVLAFGARRLSRRAASAAMSFGWRRAETLAALVNYLTLIGISVWLIIEAAGRLTAPPEVAGGMVMALAGLALVIDIATAALIFGQARDSQNIRAAFLHNLADAGASVAVLIGGAVIWAWGWHLADPLLTMLISVVILAHVAGDLPGVWRILMLAAPPGLDAARVSAAIAAVPGVIGSHHLHLWMIDEKTAAVQAHVVIAPGTDPAPILRQIKTRLAQDFALHHATLEVETEAGGCADPQGGCVSA
ncbi:cation diffusion facilitator family transporter [Paracoccus sp. p4-l81]|uniref:cation diffusion facilitator family transporter n=1 Tax=unclassified Paracoccus (in: a-proteobacteria) TaxID=2688777 RepID=UPI0035BA2A0B